MSQPDPSFSVAALLSSFKPHASWREWFAAAYVTALDSPDQSTRLEGLRTAATILGDMHAPGLCLIVALYGRSMLTVEDEAFQAHIDLCLLDMGLARPVQPGPIAVAALGKPATLVRDTSGLAAWLEDQLHLLGGSLQQAAEFALRLTAIRLGLLLGPSPPTVDQILDAKLWMRLGALARAQPLPARKATPKPSSKWWHFGR